MQVDQGAGDIGNGVRDRWAGDRLALERGRMPSRFFRRGLIAGDRVGRPLETGARRLEATERGLEGGDHGWSIGPPA